jgi:hypothetical protein
MKLGTPPLKSTRLMDQMRERIRYLHYSLKTEQGIRFTHHQDLSDQPSLAKYRAQRLQAVG